MVLLYHLTLRYSEKYVTSLSFPSFLSYGFYGVHLFFMISGFVIFMSLDRKRSASQFLLFRAFRLYPTFLCCALITYFIVSCAPLPDWDIGVLDALASTSMIALTLGYEYIDGVYWSLEVEVYFYLFLSLLFALKLRRYIVMIFALGVVAQALAESHVLTFSFLYNIPYLKPHILLSYLHLFLFGMICFEQKTFPKKWHGLALMLCVLSLYIYKPLSYCVAVTLLAVLFWSATRFEVKILRAKSLLFLGFISYPLYLLHQKIGHLFIWKGLQLGIPLLILYPAILLVVISGAYMVSRYIENPVNSFLRGMYSSYSRKIGISV